MAIARTSLCGFGWPKWQVLSSKLLLTARYISRIVFLLNMAVSPTVATFNPADQATGVAIGANILLTFSF